MPDVSLILGNRLRAAGFKLIELDDHFVELYHDDELIGVYLQHVTTHSSLIAECEEILAATAARAS